VISNVFSAHFVACTHVSRVPALSVNLRSAASERRERQTPPLWVFLLPICLAALLAVVRPHILASSATDERGGANVVPAPLDPNANTDLHVPPPPIVSPRASTVPSRVTHPEPRHSARVEVQSSLPPTGNTAPATQPVRTQPPSILAEQAAEALRGERTAEAFALASTCLRSDRHDIHCLRIAALATMHDGRFDDARPYADACMETAPEDPACLALSAQLALHDRDLTLAGILSWRLSQLAPDSVDSLMARAQLADMQGDPAAAERSYRRACQAGQASACERLGELIAAMGTGG
jgi:Flp pilus assembly protein TadD